jgi:hypothetical protein
MTAAYGGRAVMTTDPVTLTVSTQQLSALVTQLSGPTALNRGGVGGVAEYNSDGLVVQADGTVLDVDHLPLTGATGRAVMKAATAAVARTALGVPATTDLAGYIANAGGVVSFRLVPVKPDLAAVIASGVPAGTAYLVSAGA